MQLFVSISAYQQAELARRIGVGQQTISQLKRNPDKASVERILRAQEQLDVELILRLKGAAADAATLSVDSKVAW